MINNTHFDIIAGQYESSLPQHVSEHYLRKRLSFIKSIISYGNILDVCCGTGAIIHSLNNMGYRAFGVDLSLEMLKLSNQKKSGFQIGSSPFYVGKQLLQVSSTQSIDSPRFLDRINRIDRILPARLRRDRQ